ncbi:hypothetical protein MMSR116_23795 [Methylobacterium mesophilicum SR1.6/6]|uniref:Uncharacterized protein n=1 Tax=Methylobacterium mesophilicum SR1.6/6 TaxID=908290 RepID=A0A6B9FPM9_9HYPH|nr:hypothetical protein [Methylobacterium mesophilicum]QGY04593.1 hypothetical protein MMSR116_23795 [Methylobacterium mesophilicum SR1.6/6]
MRTWMVAGAAILALTVGSDAAQARGGRGFARLFSGHSHTSYRSAALNQPSRVHAEPRAGILGYRPALVLAPKPVAPVVAASAALPASSAETLVPDVPAAPPTHVETSPPAPIREARALRPSCAPGRMVGGSGSEGTGFCLIN